LSVEIEGVSVAAAVVVRGGVVDASSAGVTTASGVVTSTEVLVVSDAVAGVLVVSEEVEDVAVIAVSAEKGSPSASAPDAMRPRRSSAARPAPIFAADL
jgi:hypothetical protein